MKTKKHQNRYPALAALAIFTLFFAVAGLLWINEAQAIRISMKRIIFEGPKRSDVVTIMNNTTKEQTYRLGWRHYRMDEQRSLVLLKEEEKDSAGVKWADKMISYAPRRVTVPPGGSQQVRILLRRPRDLEPGEYRSHLWIVTELEQQEFDPTGKSATGHSFRLTMQPALTMPIFVRVGDLTVQAQMSDASLAFGEDAATLKFTLNRTGNRSLYGDVKVTCTGGSQEYLAHHVRGLAVYPEVKRRMFEMDFKIPAERLGDCRRARVDYIADRDDPVYGGKVMTSAAVTVN